MGDAWKNRYLRTKAEKDWIEYRCFIFLKWYVQSWGCKISISWFLGAKPLRITITKNTEICPIYNGFSIRPK